jgi:hypothetical protein
MERSLMRIRTAVIALAPVLLACCAHRQSETAPAGPALAVHFHRGAVLSASPPGGSLRFLPTAELERNWKGIPFVRFPEPAAMPRRR